jgi:hypothetical protein
LIIYSHPAFQLWPTVITAAGDEVEVMSAIPAFQALGHGIEVNGEMDECQ